MKLLFSILDKYDNNGRRNQNYKKDRYIIRINKLFGIYEKGIILH